MVSTRRKIVSEQDRFGGYSRQPSARVSIDDANEQLQYSNDDSNFVREPLESKSGYEKSFQEQSFSFARRSPMVNNRQQEVVEYSRVAYPDAKEFSQNSATTQREVAPRRREREDLMPSIKTRAYNKDMSDVKAETSNKTKTRVKAKTKALLAVYMLVVVILAALVIATGIAVSNINSEVQGLERELVVKNQQIILQNSQIDKITDKNYIAGVAMGKDMVKIDKVVSVDKLPIVSTVKYESRTNWFDKISDWLSKIIGG